MSEIDALVAYLDGLPEPHILFDAHYRILAANRAYRARFGQQQSVLGQTCHQVSHHQAVPCDRAGESCPLHRARETGQRERVLHLHHTPRGEAYFNIELTPIRGGNGDWTWFIEKMEPLRAAGSRPATHLLAGHSPAFLRTMDTLQRVARTDASVLLLGESGTGKELLAQAVHEASARRSKAIVAVDCSSLPETLFESELFGHEKGAFTGATHAHPGLVEAASGGTLFLDEVGDIPLTAQVKLLRLLESGTYRRVGSNEWRRADIRVVAATHRDLSKMRCDGTFRADLYYRLAAFPVRVPPLRERPEDIPAIAQQLLARLYPDRTVDLQAGALRALGGYAFPGNVRQLRNILERALVNSDGHVIAQADLRAALELESDLLACTEPTRPSVPTAPQRPSPALKDLESAFLEQALRQHDGSRAELAHKLGMSPRTLYRKLARLKPD